MKYNPKIHNRKSIRLKGYDYTKAGLYFITICTHKHHHRFGYIENATMQLNEFGQIAHEEWDKLPQRFPNLENHIFQIMPNHMHGILELKELTKEAKSSISDIVGTYKSLVYKHILTHYKKENKQMGKLWLRGFYEHIIKTEKAYNNIANYIFHNPKKWEQDKFNYKKKAEK